MTKWVGLLRAVNLGSRNQVKMAELRELLEGLGYEDVRTLLQSGNVVFATSGTAAKVESTLEAALRERFGFDITVMVRSRDDFASLVESNPFIASGDVEVKQLHATFLADEPPAAKVEALDPAAHAPDEFAFGDKVMYLRLPNGVAGSKLPAAEKLLGVTTTTRTWNTVIRLLDLVND